MEHVCRLSDPWPTGHPLPPEDPAKLQGPEVGEFMVYHHVKRYGTNGPCDTAGCVEKTNEHGTVWHEQVEDRIVRVIHRSYVWSPGECRAKGGYRHYDWSVIEEGPDEYRSLVVNDSDLLPIPEQYGRKAAVRLVYDVRGYDWSALLKGRDPEASL